MNIAEPVPPIYFFDITNLKLTKDHWKKQCEKTIATLSRFFYQDFYSNLLFSRTAFPLSPLRHRCKQSI